jgi:RHS repeat-associated protein
MRARAYLPELGRFLQEDHYEEAAGDFRLESDPLTQDRYAFLGGNPVNLIEFDGHEPAHGSFTNNPDRDNRYGGRADRNLNRDYNFERSDTNQLTVTTRHTTPRGGSFHSSRTVFTGRNPRVTFAPDAGRAGAKSVDPRHMRDEEGERINTGAGITPGSYGCACIVLRSQSHPEQAASIIFLLAGPEALAARGIAAAGAAAARRFGPRIADWAGDLRATIGPRLADETGSVPAPGTTKAPSPSPAPTSATRETPQTSFIAPSEGPAMVVPRGATGPTPPRSGTGMIFSGGRGGLGLDPRVTTVRVMDASGKHGRRMSYENVLGQKVDPYSGRTISRQRPWAHMPW